MTEIANRVAFVTGGANGIGLGIARSLAKAGARLALVDLDESALALARDELGRVTQVMTATLDVRDREGYARIADDVEQSLGPVTILINNAGVAGGAPTEKLTFNLWDWGMGINLDGVINGIQMFVPRILERATGGHIVNTASGAGLVAGPGNALYCTAKFAVVGMSEALHGELDPRGIGVSILCPGPVATGIIDRTRASQPKVTKTMSGEQKGAAFARNDMMKTYLANGTPPDAVGDMVRDAIADNRLYIHTDRLAVEKIRERGQAIIDAMPGPPERFKK